MEFRTIVDIPRPEFEIRPMEPMLFVGSCFADNIGKRFSDEHFDTVVNPFGVMYNPASILHTVDRLLAGERPEGDYKGEFVPSTAILTLGTNHVYIENATGEIVDNCRKRPQRLFTERVLTIDECYGFLCKAVRGLRTINNDMNIVVTVSPIRYRKYGYHGSQLSKSVLLMAADRLVSECGVYYFPAYEIVNDELRDYRFYNADMLHPSAVAVEYIWERFVGVAFSDEAKHFLDEWKPIKEALGHRPFNPESAEYKAFMARTRQRIEDINKKYRRK